MGLNVFQKTSGKSTAGFTLLEMMVVVIIISVLASLAITNYFPTTEKSKAAEGETILIALYGAQKRYFLDQNVYTTTLANLDIDIRVPTYFNNPPTLALGPTLASVTRTGVGYTLSIDWNANVSCSGGPAGLCTRMGY